MIREVTWKPWMYNVIHFSFSSPEYNRDKWMIATSQCSLFDNYSPRYVNIFPIMWSGNRMDGCICVQQDRTLLPSRGRLAAYSVFLPFCTSKSSGPPVPRRFCFLCFISVFILPSVLIGRPLPPCFFVFCRSSGTQTLYFCHAVKLRDSVAHFKGATGCSLWGEPRVTVPKLMIGKGPREKDTWK